MNSVIEVVTQDTVAVDEEVITVVTEGIQGPPGPKGDPGGSDIVSDPLAYYILAKS